MVMEVIAAAAIGALLYERQRSREYAVSPFGVLSPAATRYALKRWRGPCAVIGLDIRKMHDLIAVCGYDETTGLGAQLVQARLRDTGRPWRKKDIVGQVGGDEFVIVVADPAAGPLVVERVLERARDLTARMPQAQRDALAVRTGGLVDGVHVALALQPLTTNPLQAMWDTVNAACQLKDGVVTGDRSTSGSAGTQVCVLPAGA